MDGPTVILKLDGDFWHKRSTVLGRAAMWLNAKMPEIVEVRVESLEELEDFEEVMDENTGASLIIFRRKTHILTLFCLKPPLWCLLSVPNYPLLTFLSQIISPHRCIII